MTGSRPGPAQRRRPAGSDPRDTIAAQASASGPAAVALLRLSGPRARPLARALTVSGRLPPVQRASRMRLRRPDSGASLGDAVLTVFRGPRSYTGEDLVEIATYGGLAAPQAVLEALLALGARPAAPGEFTRRALARGRIDLAEAEALAAVAEARTAGGLAAGLRAMDGGLASLAAETRAALSGLLAEIEGRLELAEEEQAAPEFAGRADTLSGLARRLAAETERALRTELAVEGLRLAIVGPPNAGKSSLFNCLLGQDRAITDPRPGTTRDTLEAEIALAGQRLRLVDTAGMRRARAPVEAEGVRRSRAEAERADLVLVVADLAGGGRAAVAGLLSELAGKPVVLALNKCDLVPAPRPLAAAADAGTTGEAHIAAAAGIAVSAATGTGLAELEGALAQAAAELAGGAAEGSLALNRRQRALLARCGGRLAELAASFPTLGPEIAALAMREALADLAELAGEVDSEALLDEIFARFCVGK